MSQRIRVGWAESDITPTRFPVALAGFFYARICESIKDPLKATVCAIEVGGEQLVFVTCDLIDIPDVLRDSVRAQLAISCPEIQPLKVIINATHTHTGPEFDGSELPGANGVDLGVLQGNEFISWVSDVIVQCIGQAWSRRKQGGIAFGLDFAHVGRNRRWVDLQGKATMYGLTQEAAPRFLHIEGYEDHSLNLLATYDLQNKPTGLIVNIACPSQQEKERHVMSADFWHETRMALRARFGEDLFVLPQCAYAGEITSIPLYEKTQQVRMLDLLGRTPREEIAIRIAEAVARILPCMATTIETTPLLKHEVETVHLPANNLSQEQVTEARKQAAVHLQEYEVEISRLKDHPDLREQPRWYLSVTGAFRSMQFHQNVILRYSHQGEKTTVSAEVHVARLGSIAFASNPFECYLDYGARIKVLSAAAQTFLIQLAGQGTYVPSRRSLEGGGYGSTPASNPVGPDGGEALVDHIVQRLAGLFSEQ